MRLVKLTLLFWLVLFSNQLIANPTGRAELLTMEVQQYNDRAWVVQLHLPHHKSNIVDHEGVFKLKIEGTGSIAPVWLDGAVGLEKINKNDNPYIKLFHEYNSPLRKIPFRVANLRVNTDPDSTWPPYFSLEPSESQVIPWILASTDNGVGLHCNKLLGQDGDLNKRLAVWCTLHDARGGDWLKSPIHRDSSNSPEKWVVFRANDFRDGKPTLGFIVSDAISLEAIVGNSTPVLEEFEEDDKGKEFHLIDFGNPMSMLRNMSKDNNKARVLFNMKGLGASSEVLTTLAFPSSQALLYYPGGEGNSLSLENDALLKINFKNNNQRSAIKYCSDNSDSTECQRRPFGENHNPVAKFLEAFLPYGHQETSSYDVQAIPNWLFKRLESVAWDTGNYEVIEGNDNKKDKGILSRNSLSKQNECIGLDLSENESLKSLFRNTYKATDDRCKGDLNEFSLVLKSTKRDYCLASAEGAKTIDALQATNNEAPEAFKISKGALSQTYVYLEDNGTERYIATRETSIRDWTEFLGGTGGQDCRNLLLDDNLMPWLTPHKGENQFCHEGKVAEGEISKHPAHYAAYEFFYSAVSSQKLNKSTGDESLDFENYKTLCYPEAGKATGADKKMCDVRAYLVLKALRSYQANNADAFKVTEGNETAQVPVSCSSNRVGQFAPDDSAKSLCDGLKYYWDAAMSPSTDDGITFLDYPVVMVTPNDVKKFITHLQAGKCPTGSFKLPSKLDLIASSKAIETSAGFKTLFDGDSLNGGVPEQMVFKLKSGLSAGNVSNPIDTKVNRGGRFNIYGALTGVRELVVDDKPYGFDASKWREEGEVFRDFSWNLDGLLSNSNQAAADNDAEKAIPMGDPITGFRLIFNPVSEQNN